MWSRIGDLRCSIFYPRPPLSKFVISGSFNKILVKFRKVRFSTASEMRSPFASSFLFPLLVPWWGSLRPWRLGGLIFGCRPVAPPCRRVSAVINPQFPYGTFGQYFRFISRDSVLS